MLFRAVLCATLATVAFGDANAMKYMDCLLKQLPSQAMSLGLDPLSLHPFQFKVAGNGLTTREFKANVTRGTIHGLGDVLRRGDCSSVIVAGQQKVACNVSLSSVRILLDAEVKGDSIMAERHNISTTTVVDVNTRARVEVAGARWSFGTVSQVALYPITMTSSVSQGKLDLNKSRFEEFVQKLNAELAKHLFSTLQGPFFRAMNDFAKNCLLPF